VPGERDEKIKLLRVNNNVGIRRREEVVFNAFELSCQLLLLVTYNLSSPTLLCCYAGAVFEKPIEAMGRLRTSYGDQTRT
jgi:hypothetical protein